jgi:CheY-like chemotaxis protein
LLTDDDEDDQEIFSMAIKETDPHAQCVFANDGVYAPEELERDNSFIPSVIFIDINMPRMNGIQCLSEIKKLSRLQHVPSYIYSTSAEKPIVDECLRLGASGFIKKLISIEELQKQLLRVFTQLKMYSQHEKNGFC